LRATIVGWRMTQPRAASAAATAAGAVGKRLRSPVGAPAASMKATCAPTSATSGEASRKAT